MLVGSVLLATIPLKGLVSAPLVILGHTICILDPFAPLVALASSRQHQDISMFVKIALLDDMQRASHRQSVNNVLLVAMAHRQE